MGSVYPRGKKLWFEFKGPDGRRVQKSSGFEVGQEKQAQAVLESIERRIEAGKVLAEREMGPINVARYAAMWIERRRMLDLSDWKNDEGRLRLHILPHIGSLRLDKVRPRHLNDLFLELRVQGKLAPHTLRNIYSVLKALFRDALIEDLITASPCILTKHHLGDDVYKDPQAQANCRYSRGELVVLLFDDRLSWDSRVFYAIAGLTGMRMGEVCALRWREIDFDCQPLGKLSVLRSHKRATTKTKQPRLIPIHPVLASILTKWQRKGWPELMGREPGPDDLVVPCPATSRRRAGAMHIKSTVNKRAHRDLERVGIDRPAMPIHALRSTFISLAQEDGADRNFISMLTHPKKAREAFDLYTKIGWAPLCREVAKLQIPVPYEPTESDLLQSALQSEEKPNYINDLKMEAPGVEPPDSHFQKPYIRRGLAPISAVFSKDWLRSGEPLKTVLTRRDPPKNASAWQKRGNNFVCFGQCARRATASDVKADVYRFTIAKIVGRDRTCRLGAADSEPMR